MYGQLLVTTCLGKDLDPITIDLSEFNTLWCRTLHSRITKLCVIYVQILELFYVGSSGKADGCILKTDEERRMAFIHYHDSPQGGHMGHDKIYCKKINSRYNWSELYVQDVQWISESERCQNFEHIKPWHIN